MDFVVVGLGLGALAVLWGVIILGWVTARWERLAARATAEDAAYSLAVAADRRDAGQASIYGGGAVLLATIGALAGSLDDRTGAFLVATTATVSVVGFLLWRYLHRSRRPMVPRRRLQPAPMAAAASGPALAVEPAPVRVVPLWDEGADAADDENDAEERLDAVADAAPPGTDVNEIQAEDELDEGVDAEVVFAEKIDE